MLSWVRSKHGSGSPLPGDAPVVMLVSQLASSVAVNKTNDLISQFGRNLAPYADPKAVATQALPSPCPPAGGPRWWWRESTKKLDEVTRELADTKQSLSAKEEAATQLERETDGLKREMENVALELERARTGARDAAGESTKKLGEVTRELADAKQSLSAREEAAGQLKREADELKREVESVKLELKRARTGARDPAAARGATPGDATAAGGGDGAAAASASASASASTSASASAFCLLIKDDNDKLPEWVAYHYHVFGMRRLIVAVDPTSRTSPLEVLRPWGRAVGHFDLDFTLWNDEDYVPAYFKERNYAQIPNSLADWVGLADAEYPKDYAEALNQPINQTAWHDATYIREHPEEVRVSLHAINNHRFRQKNFVSECFRRVRQEQKEVPPASWVRQEQKEAPPANSRREDIAWTVHIDTDEFLVPNPWMAAHAHGEGAGRGTEEVLGDGLGDVLARGPADGALWALFRRFYARTPTLARRACVLMPRILFGSKEDGGRVATTSSKHPNSDGDTVSTSWNHTRFESLRWKYHADFGLKVAPKTMINVATLAEQDEIFQTRRAFSIHRPLYRSTGESGCGQPSSGIMLNETDETNNRKIFMEPLAVYHYLGSIERYLSREDARRDVGAYHKKNATANYAEGDENRGDGSSHGASVRWWIGGWLDSFVETHGSEVAFTVLGKPYASQKRDRA